METKRSLAYLRAKKKVETLKGFYSHLVVYILVNTGIILVSANVFNSKKIDFTDWSNYVTAFFWGFGLVSHALYVFYVINIENNIFKRWEEKKIKQFLDEDEF
ncbi:MAG: 2TM domain-containing protein [Flavobacteriaceae bacterium]|nr:2TM domain-containing protein [Flavobacteriaceae bacterium]